MRPKRAILWKYRPLGLVMAGIVALSLAFAAPSAAGSEKVSICHKPDHAAQETLEVAASAVAAHLGHGDFLGSCIQVEVEVSSKATGGFGCLPGAGAPGEDATLQFMVKGVDIRKGESVTISATGIIQLFPGKVVGPDGDTFFPRSADCWAPLEEALVDAGGFPTTDPVPNLGALMGAFVTRNAIGPDFQPFNDDPDPNPDVAAMLGTAIPDPLPVGGISSTELFFIGSNPLTFTAPAKGTLFLGINEVYTGNNDLFFTVSIVG